MVWKKGGFLRNAGRLASAAIAAGSHWAATRLGRSNAKAAGFRRKAKTRTKRFKKLKSHLGQLIRGQGAFSVYRPRPGKLTLSRRVMANISGRNEYIWNSSARIAALDGQQQATTMLYYDQVPCLQMYNAAISDASGNASALNPSARVLFKGSYHEYTFTNASNAIAYVTIYDIRYKRDLETANDGSIYLPEIAWDIGERNQGNANGRYSVGSYPSRVQNFNDFYKIEKKTVHLLSPGDVHKHRVMLNPNKFMSGNRILEKNFYGDLTRCTMIVVQGTPVDSSGATLVSDPSGAPTLLGGVGRLESDASGNIINTFGAGSTVTTSPAVVNIVYSARYIYQWMTDMDSDTKVINNLPNPGQSNLDVMACTGIPYTFTAT